MSKYLLTLLLYMDFGGYPTYDFTTAHCMAVKSGAQLRPCNRVCNTQGVAGDEVEAIKNYFSAIPFTWIIEADDTASSAVLQDNGLKKVAEFWAMSADLSWISSELYSSDIHVSVVRNTSQINTWLSITSTVYNYPAEQLEKAISYLGDKGNGSVTLYLGFYNNVACAASMSIHHGDYVTLHMVGTLPDYRNKGLGYAVTYKPLVNAAAQGCKHALLLGSKMGASLYARLGFKEYALYYIYALI